MNTPTVSAFLAISVDGYLAGKNGDLTWLDKANQQVPEGEDCGYNAFIKPIDALIMGRKTYEKILSFKVVWPYTMPVYVLTSHPLTVPDNLKNKIIATQQSPLALIRQLAKQNHQHIYVDGGQTVRSFLDAGLLNHLILTQIPILLGEGIPLFTQTPHSYPLRLVTSHVYPFGFVQLHYQIETTA